MRDRRYEAAIHLVTAANGAEDHYSLTNNEARYESLIEARNVDKKLQNAWTGHSHLSIIDNYDCKSFEEKLTKLLNIVFKYIGSPTSQHLTRKYLLKSNQSIPEITGIQVVKIYIEDSFLKSNSSRIVKIQKRGQSGSYIYTHSIREKLGAEEYAVNKCQITAREYIILEQTKDVARKTIKRMRQCFIYKNQYFILNTYLNVKNGISVLRIDNNRILDEIELPSNVSILRDVTNDPGYSTYIMSKVNWYVSSKDKDIILDQ